MAARLPYLLVCGKISSAMRIYTFLIMFVLLFTSLVTTFAQTHLGAEEYEHQGVNHHIQNTNALPAEAELAVNYNTTDISGNQNENTDFSSGKIEYRNEDGCLRYEVYNPATKEINISDSTGRIVEYVVQVNANKTYILNANRVFLGYIIKKGKVLRKYDPTGKLIGKVKVKSKK
ncbi:MAG TPA: hypothetical protein VFX43_04965 [Chitinophagaceae bacterium]|nr:hypothetical protein [Chitinophagaceae bacterium]